jgi:C4-type Zn-finger protein
MSDPQPIKLACPLCPNKHTFPVTIERSSISYFMRPEDDAPKRRSFTRLFVCPTTSQQFQARLTFTETPYDPILTVTVGVADPHA